MESWETSSFLPALSHNIIQQPKVVQPHYLPISVLEMDAVLQIYTSQSVNFIHFVYLCV